MSHFQLLLKHYPSTDPCDAKGKDGKLLFENQCAIRVSYAMKKTGVAFTTFPSKRKCWLHPDQDHILGAAELADWIDKTALPFISKSIDVTGGDWRKKVLRKTGIICFEDYYTPSGGSGGDHIDLWDGNSLTGAGSWMRVTFGIVIPGIWSDLGKAKKIRFYEVK